MTEVKLTVFQLLTNSSFQRAKSEAGKKLVEKTCSVAAGCSSKKWSVVQQQRVKRRVVVEMQVLVVHRAPSPSVVQKQQQGGEQRVKLRVVAKMQLLAVSK